MGYLRFFWTALYVVVAFLISLPFLLLDYIIGLFSMKARDRFTLGVVRVTFRILLFLAGVKLHISGYENIPKDKPVVYIGNHRSFFDVITTYALYPNMTAFVAKKSFKKIPFLSWWMMMLHNLFLDRGNIKQGMQTILTAIEYVKGGMSVVIFPEGTRNRTYEEDMLEFHEGSFKISDKSGAPVIPMTLYNTSAIFEDHFPKIYSQHVFIDFGKPIYPDELDKADRKHFGAYTREIMLKTYGELREQHEKLNAK